MLRATERIITPIHLTGSPNSTQPLSPRPDSGISEVSRSGISGPPSPTSRSRVRDCSETPYQNQDSSVYTPLSPPCTPDLNSPFDSHPAKRDENIDKSNNKEINQILSSHTDNSGNLEPRRKSTRPTPAREAQEKRVQRVFDIIKQLKNEELSTDDILIVEELTESAFKDLRDKLQREDDDLKRYFEDDLCYDYPYRSKQTDHIVFRMNSELHEHVSREIFMTLANQLKTHSKRVTNSELPGQIPSKRFIFTGSARISFGDKSRGNCPDESFRYPDCKYPGLVIEVSWSQRPRELPKRAKDFITKSNGGVRTVISIDVHDSYEKKRQSGMPGEAKFSVWRADWVSGNKVIPKMSVDNQVFQNERGEFNSSASDLHLTFEDFLCRKVADTLGPDKPRLIVEAKELYEWVQEGLAALNAPPPGPSAEQNNASEQQVLPVSPPDSHAGGGEMSQNPASSPGQPVDPHPENNLPQGQAPLQTQVERPPRRARIIGADKISAYFRRQRR
ncbi:hypothetical protein F4813DRAFT_292721 [Daldinia decipiens]|uniref:uncharacterized protein n=1 Tax=Daldinia decipiens TaxID=326647 RepID=UPI0020C3D1D1|nr:uncharacterized protein F4813DRAFT_292721 [Daldinia decipiens]KAI1660384.1 hypothetical protein F4813DRAFT_292721 [Daldinia decipiens]